MKILVATGSFKDVFSPSEACEVLCSSLDKDKNECSSIPFCDGGEYTMEVLRSLFSYETVAVDNVPNAYGKPVRAEYLIEHDGKNGAVAHIVSSEILRLYPEEDAWKNPLALSDFGFGVLIADALKRGCGSLKLYFGGTSTASCGFGAFQALGGRLLDASGKELPSPCTAGDLSRIAKLLPPDLHADSIDVHVIGDGNSKVCALPGITGLKIGRTYAADRESIVAGCMEGVENVVRLTGISPDFDFSGAAGGLLFGLEQVFPRIRYTLGGLYFKDVLGIERAAENSDLIITGEGRYDNTADGKAPSVIAGIARKYGKPCILACGQIEKKAVKSYEGGVIGCESEPAFAAQGISTVLTAQEFYDQAVLPESYADRIAFFRRETPALMKSLFGKVGL